LISPQSVTPNRFIRSRFSFLSRLSAAQYIGAGAILSGIAAGLHDEEPERGQDNCRRYREACQQPVVQIDCMALRAQCMFKNELGQQGQGNCRRYRENCTRG
jgi:hypothetical protein